MGTFSYLVRQDNKTMFNLGKGSWWTSLDIFKTGSFTRFKELAFPYNEMGEHESNFDICDKELLSYEIKNELECTDKQAEEIADKIMLFCDNKLVHLISEGSYDDLLRELKNHGFKQTSSRYLDETV